jgi:hypothetical protein
MLFGVQIIGILFALAMMYFTFLYYKKKSYTYRSLVIWLLIWTAFLILVLFPTTIYGIMQSLKIERTVDFFVIGGFLFFSVIIFYIYSVVKKNDRKLDELVRALAIKRSKKRK